MTQIRKHFDSLKANATTVTLVLSLGAGLVAGTWVVAKLAVQSQMAALEKELEFYKSTRDIDIPKLLNDFNKFVGSANAELELRELQAEYEKLKEEHEKLNTSYNALRQTVKLKDKFALSEGQSRTILNGTTIIGIQSLYDSRATATFNGDTELGWDVGEYKDVELGGIQYRIILEEILKTNPLKAQFRVDEISEVTQ